VTNAAGCISIATANVVIPSAPSTPSAPIVGIITPPTCSVATGSVALSGLPATGTWTVSPGGTSGGTGSGTTTIIAGLNPNTYTFTVTNTSGCISIATANVVIPVAPSIPSAPIVGTITVPTCSVPTGSVALSGLPSTGTWTVSPGGTSGGSGTGTTTTIAGLNPNTYTFTVTNAAGCISVATANVVIPAAPSTPSVPIVGTITVPTCSVPTGSVALSGLPSTGTWTVSPGGTSGGSGTGTTTTIAGLNPNTYTFTVTNSAGCISIATANVVIPAAPSTPSAPIVGTITPPTCSVATGSVALSGLPATGTWTVSPGGTSGGTGTGTTTTITGLSPNTYTFTVTNSAGCISIATTNVVIPAAPSTPSAPIVGTITQPTCTVAGSVILSGLPSGSWTINPGAITGSTTSQTIPNLTLGTYNFTVANAAGCVSPASANVVINAAPSTPTLVAGTPTNPSSCSGTGTIPFTTTNFLDGSYILTYTGAGSPQTVFVASNAFTLSGLTAGTYSGFSITNAGCTGTDAGSKTLIDPLLPILVAGTPTNPSSCGGTGNIPFTTSNLPNDNYTLTYTGVGSPQTVTVSSNAFVLSGLPAGVYSNFSITNINCTGTAATSKVLTDPGAPTLIAGIPTNPNICGGTGSIPFTTSLPNGNFILTYTGAGSPKTVTVASNEFILSGLPAGAYSGFSVTNAGCTGTLSSTVVLIGTSFKPIVYSSSAPACSSGNGIVAVSAPANGPGITYTINGFYPSTVSETNSTGFFSLPVGNYSVSASFSGCNTQAVGVSVDAGAIFTGRPLCVTEYKLQLAENCVNTIQAATLLTGNNAYCYSFYNIAIENSSSGSTNSIGVQDIGKTLKVFVRDGFGNSCSTNVLVEDKKGPVITGPIDRSVFCNEIKANGLANLRLTGQPIIVNECTKTTTTFYDKVISLSCNSFLTAAPSDFPKDMIFNTDLAQNITNIIIRTFSVKDAFDNETSTRQAIYVKNNSLADVIVPTNVTVTCTDGVLNINPEAIRRNGKFIIGTGSPSYNTGGTLDEYSSCDINSSFTDIRIENGVGYTIERTWVIRDKCKNQTKTAVQVISVINSINCTTPMSLISGTLKTESNQAVNNATVSNYINGAFSASALSTLDGDFSISTIPSNSTVVKVQKLSTEDKYSGITTFDISRISKHILDIEKLTSPYAIIAADVNRDGEIDGADLLEVRNFILRKSPNLLGGIWRFIDKSYVFKNPLDPFAEDFPELVNLANGNTKANFIATKLGDVNDSYKSNFLKAETRNSKALNLIVEDKTLVAGNDYTVQFLAENMDIAAFQGTISLKNATIKSIQAGDLDNYNAGNFGIFKDAITTSWFGKTLKPNVFTLSFTANENGKLNDILAVGSELTPAIANDTQGNEIAINLKFTENKKTGGEFALYQNIPNPVSLETTIGFNLPKATKAHLTIYSVDGKNLFTKNIEGQEGFNLITINKSELNTNGVLFYRLETAEHSASKRMVIIR
jgi:hypothetical protein